MERFELIVHGVSIDLDHGRFPALTHIGEVRPIHNSMLDLFNDHIHLIVVLQFLVVHTLVPALFKSTPNLLHSASSSNYDSRLDNQETERPVIRG